MSILYTTIYYLIPLYKLYKLDKKVNSLLKQFFINKKQAIDFIIFSLLGLAKG